MAHTERTTQPSPGSNDPGSGESDTRLTGVSPGTDTQAKIPAKGGNKHKENINDDEEVVKNRDGEKEFLKSAGTDE